LQEKHQPIEGQCYGFVTSGNCTGTEGLHRYKRIAQVQKNQENPESHAHCSIICSQPILDLMQASLKKKYSQKAVLLIRNDF
jgi:hypothetical protein